MGISAHEAADLFRREPERFLDVGAGEVAYRRVGTGPDVLFVHGWPVSGATFRTLLPYLADHVTCHIIDLPGAGSSRFNAETSLTMARQIDSVRKVVDMLGLENIAVVGHDSGGLTARHAFAGDPRVRALCLIDTEMPHGMSWRFKAFVSAARLPGFGAVFGWAAGRRRLRRNKLVLGGVFNDSSLLGGEFDEFFLAPLNQSASRLSAAVQIARSFDFGLIRKLSEVHRRIEVPVTLVWGEEDLFFPVAAARTMADSFPNAHIEVIPGAGLFAHEERPAATAAAMLPALTKQSTPA